MVAVFGAIALLYALLTVGQTLYFVSRSHPQTGVVTEREKVKFRSWKITVRYQDGSGAEQEFSAVGYYDGEAFAPNSEIAVRYGDSGVKLADFGDLWLTSALASLFCALLVWLYFLLG